MPAGDDRAVTLGRLVKEHRLDLGLNRPAFVREMLRHGADITPDYLNKIESGAASLVRASLEVREAIRIVLGYDATRWHEATGLYVQEGSAPSTWQPPVPPVIPIRDTPILIPPELERMIEKHADTYPQLLDRAVQRGLAAPRNFMGVDAGPQTEQDWFEYWLLNRRWLTS